MIVIGTTKQIGTTRFIEKYYDKLKIDWEESKELKSHLCRLGINKAYGDFDIKFIFVTKDNIMEVVKKYPNIKVALVVYEENLELLDILEEQNIEKILISKETGLSGHYDYIEYLLKKENKQKKLDNIENMILEFNKEYDENYTLIGVPVFRLYDFKLEVNDLYSNLMYNTSTIPLSSDSTTYTKY